ncbi:MAG: alpha/beta hydrolase [Pseudomonadota bacterium]
MNRETRQTVRVGEGRNSRDIAVRKREGSGPGLVWLGGFKSDMTGTKAESMSRFAASNGLTSVRFDYAGHGESGGEFADHTISDWVADSLTVFEQLTKGPQILVGSSMGGWIALRLAEILEKSDELSRLAGMLLIAPAPDFTHELMQPAFTNQEREQLNSKGYIEQHSEYSDEPTTITRELIDDGERNRVLHKVINLRCPVEILQGKNDPDVPYQHAIRAMDCLVGTDISFNLIADGDHRLSRPWDIAKMESCLERLVQSRPQN